MTVGLAVRVMAAAIGITMLAGCSDGIRQTIRKHDFRAQRAAERAANVPPPSPIANVADMPGWTTDLDGALAFGRDQGQKTLVFIQAGNAANSRTMKSSLNSQQISGLSNVQKVTFDAAASPEFASRFQVPPPAVLVLDSSGAAIGQQSGILNKSALLGALR